MRRESVLLLNPPGDKLYIRDYYCSFSSKADYYWPPQDLIGLSGIIGLGFRVQVLDAIINKVPERMCLERILREDYKAVIFTTGTATIKKDLAFAEKIKKEKKDIKIIASAAIMKFLGQKLLEDYDFIDCVSYDFTEKDILSFLRDECGAPLRGLIYRLEDKLIEDKGKAPIEFEIPIPRHELFDFQKYRIPLAKKFPFTVVVTSLGCPYHCGFCTAGAFGYRVRKVDNVIEELDYLHKLGIREILFQDPTLTVNTKRVVELCQKMVNHNFHFTWSSNAEIKSLNEEIVSWMREAGCHTMSIGIESGDEEILRKYSKWNSAEKIEQTIDLLNKHKIRVLGYFIIGLPGETRESILKTIELAKHLKIDIASFAIATPDVGTPLRKEALEKGWIPADLDVFDSTEFPVINAGDLSKEEIWGLRKKAVREFYLRPSYLIRKLLQVRSLRELKILASNAFSLFRK